MAASRKMASAPGRYGRRRRQHKDKTAAVDPPRMLAVASLWPPSVPHFFAARALMHYGLQKPFLCLTGHFLLPSVPRPLSSLSPHFYRGEEQQLGSLKV